MAVAILRLLAIWLLIISLAARSSQAAELEEIERRGKLIVAVKDNQPPLGFYDSSGNLQGLEIEIGRRLAEELLGSPEAVIFVPVSNQDRLNAVLEDKVDLAIAGVTFTSSRARLVHFSPYYYLDGTGLITKNPQVETWSDLEDKKIALLNNSSTVNIIRESLPNAQLVGVSSYQEAFALLEAGMADAFAGDNTILTGWVQEYPAYRRLPDTISAAPLCVIMPKGLQYLSLHKKVNKAIARWRSTWLPERIKYWGLPFTSKNEPLTTNNKQPTTNNKQPTTNYE